MTQLLNRPPRDDPTFPLPSERPRRRGSASFSMASELLLSALASVALVWLVFAIGGIVGPFGFGVCSVVGFFIIYGCVCWKLYDVLIMKDRLATLAIWVGAMVAFIPLVAVIGFVVVKGGSVVLARFPHFFITDMSHLTANSPVTAVGASAAIVGTVEQVGLATVFAVPLAIMTALYLVENRNPYSRVVSLIVDAMAGAPAIILALFIFIVWVVPRHTEGQSGFAAALALTIMMLPIVTRTSQEVLAIVPGSLTEAALALGSPRWRSALRVTLPTARVGLVTATILGVARIAGETAPVIFPAGGNYSMNWNPFSGKQGDLPLTMYQLISQSGKNITRDSWGVGFVLVLVVLTLFLLARLIGAKKPGKRRRFFPRRALGSPEGAAA
jgi:phosphate transport system permease protein